MKRYRTFNAAPARTSSETVSVISSVIAASLASSASLDATDISAALEAAEPALLMLVSSRNLKTTPLVLVAGNTTLEITCLYDADAVGSEENRNPVPGMSTATSYHLHLPTPDPIGGTIEALAGGHPALTVDEPALEANSKPSVTARAQAPLDMAALKGLL